MCMGSKEDFFGGYDYFAQAGIVHIANHHISPGKKQWTWGNHEFGYAWDRNLTDADERGEFARTSKSWPAFIPTTSPTSVFCSRARPSRGASIGIPIQKIGPAQPRESRRRHQLCVLRQVARLGVSDTRQLSGAIIVTGQGQKTLRIRRPRPHARLAARQRNQTAKRRRRNGFAFARQRRNEGEIISLSTQSRASKARCRRPPPNRHRRKKFASADELYITGLHLEQYRHATRCPTIYWREALRRDPLDSRCNNALGLWHLRRGEFPDSPKNIFATPSRA
jgi:hypothetical protein